jgi:hypothetical protein
MCPHATICVPYFYNMCRHATMCRHLCTPQSPICVCPLYYVCVRMLLYMCPHANIDVCSCNFICVLIYASRSALYMCVLMLLYMRPHSHATIDVCSCDYICVLICKPQGLSTSRSSHGILPVNLSRTNYMCHMQGAEPVDVTILEGWMSHGIPPVSLSRTRGSHVPLPAKCLQQVQQNELAALQEEVKTICVCVLCVCVFVCIYLSIHVHVCMH